MSEFRQPWRRVYVGDRRVRLQVLDPQTAFEWEPRLIQALGDTLAFAAAAPDQITGAVMKHASGGRPIESAIKDPVHGPAMAAASMHTFAHLLADCLEGATVSPRFVGRAFRAMVIGKLEVDREPVEDMRDYLAVGFRPMDKWRLLGAQIKLSFGPLWTRKPYRLKSTHETYGVDRPKDVPMAVAWADSLAVRGSASSSVEILTAWTPERMIQVVEVAAQTAEIEKRAALAVRKGQR